jgi:hypothetical protein
LPYLDGPTLENLILPGMQKTIKFYWIIPITENEVKYKVNFAPEALEKKFEDLGLDYLDAHRGRLTSSE